MGGTLAILALEWGNILKPLSPGDRLLVDFFQSVTPRTAGFNDLSIGAMANQTLLFLILLMFIGASPGCTGGGGISFPPELGKQKDEDRVDLQAAGQHAEHQDALTGRGDIAEIAGGSHGTEPRADVPQGRGHR